MCSRSKKRAGSKATSPFGAPAKTGRPCVAHCEATSPKSPSKSTCQVGTSGVEAVPEFNGFRIQSSNNLLLSNYHQWAQHNFPPKISGVANTYMIYIYISHIPAQQLEID